MRTRICECVKKADCLLTVGGCAHEEIMSNVTIETADEKKMGASSIFQDLKDLKKRVRERAFRIFAERHGGDGHATEHSISEERDLLWR